MTDSGLAKRVGGNKRHLALDETPTNRLGRTRLRFDSSLFGPFTLFLVAHLSLVQTLGRHLALGGTPTNHLGGHAYALILAVLDHSHFF